MTDDLIRRDDVLKEIWEWVSNREFSYTNATYWLQKRIEAIPSAQQKQGEWIEQDDCWQCSECGDEFVLEVGVKPIDAKMNFCPNCGARMKGADDE